MPSDEPTPDDLLDQRLSRLGEHLDAERHARHDRAIDERVAIDARDATRDPAGYRRLAAAAMIVVAVAAATFITLSRGTSSGPASTGTTIAAPASSVPRATTTTAAPAMTTTTLPGEEPPETIDQPVATVPVPSVTEPVGTTPTATAPHGATTTTPLLLPTTADVWLCQRPYGPVSFPCLYPLQEGDTPSTVAERFGTTVDELMLANPSFTELVEAAGARWEELALLIPVPGGEPDASGGTPRCRALGPQPAACIYRLGFGDSPMSVSEQFGITLEAFMAANPLADSDLSIWLAGTEVLIPAA